jgi:hypothetical protein
MMRSTLRQYHSLPKLPLFLKSPPPSDIQIAQEHAQNMLPIKQLADAVGIQECELEVFGKYKAKV